eukprot:Phypoly_transcript_18961.p1 GENE.Phypoly_transcript_18961~~Phypoly_transcript_18961.p1  ORF type:complete len:211 (+),score=53.97 Phypoly_transcript_18961:108-740(+)
MDINTLLEHLGVMEAQNRNEEALRIEEEALHRETKSQLQSAQDQLTMAREREKQMIEKNANLTALKDTLETTVNQLNNDLKGSKVEMSILKDFAAKQESLLKAAKLDFLKQLEEVNDKMLKRNADIDKIVAMARGDGLYFEQRKDGKDEKDEIERIRREKDTTIKILKDENKTLTDEQEKDRKTMEEMYEVINELRTCRNCGSVREDITC